MRLAERSAAISLPIRTRPVARRAIAILLIAYYLAQFLSLSDPMVIFAVGLFVLFAAIALLQALFDLCLLSVAMWLRRKARNPEPIFGTARFASRKEAKRAGMLDPSGLFLGKLGSEPLFFRGKSALLTVAPPRSGKGLSAVVPNLLHFQGSVFVTDPKGELAAMTSEHREGFFGHRVVIINPWGLHGLRQDRYNPLQPLIEIVRHPYWQRSAGDETRRLALQLLPEPDRAANNAFFRNGSRKMLRALMLHLATWENGRRCTLPDIWRALTSPNRMEVYVGQMCMSDALGGTVRDIGNDLKTLMENDPEHFDDFREGALQAVDIYDPSGWLGQRYRVRMLICATSRKAGLPSIW